MNDEAKVELYSSLTDIQKRILEKKHEIDSIVERVDQLKKSAPHGDDAHKAGVKLRFEKNRLVELQCKEVEIKNTIETLKWNTNGKG